MKTTLFMMMAVSTVLAACAATAGERMSPNTMIKQMTPSVRSSAATTFEDTHGVAQESNELRCRGGDGIRFVTVEGRTNSSGEATSYVVVYFHEAAQASGLSGRSLQPGQCAFPQRALRTDEPLEMVQEMVSFGQTRQQLHGTPVDTSPTAAERFPDARNVQEYMADPKHYWSFFVQQNAPLPFARFDVASSRYWKPVPSVGDTITDYNDRRRAGYGDRTVRPDKP